MSRPRPPDEAESRAAITNLLHNYAYAVDSGDFDEVGRLFEHATFRGIGDARPLSGSEVVEKFKRNLILYADGTPRTQHRIANVVVDVAEDGVNANSKAYVSVVQGVPGHPLELIVAARYDDRFAFEGGRWRFAERVASGHLLGDLSRHNRLT